MKKVFFVAAIAISAMALAAESKTETQPVKAQTSCNSNTLFNMTDTVPKPIPDTTRMPPDTIPPR